MAASRPSSRSQSFYAHYNQPQATPNLIEPPLKTRSLFKSRHNVNLWIVPLKMSLAAIGLFAFTSLIDMLAAYHYIRLPDWFTMGGIDDARAILSAMLGCVSTVLALIFSVALLVLSMVANLFGPRLLYRFVQDWVTQACIGLFMGAFIYVFLCFLVTHKDEHSVFIPQLSLITSWFLVLAAFAFLVFYSHRVAILIQNPDAIGRIVLDIQKVASRPLPEPITPGSAQDKLDLARLAAHHAAGAPVLSTHSGYLQLIDHEGLLKAAARANALIVMPKRPGQFVFAGEPLASVSPATAASALTPSVLAGVSLGHHRVLAQDIEFGLAQIVEIAIRALSPAINDTFTGIASVDLLGESLIIIHRADRIDDGRWHDATSTLRLQVRPLLFSRLIRQSFDQIRQAAAATPAVSLRLLDTLGRLAPIARNEIDRLTLLEQADAVWETATSTNPAGIDRQDLERAWRSARTALESGSAS